MNSKNVYRICFTLMTVILAVYALCTTVPLYADDTPTAAPKTAATDKKVNTDTPPEPAPLVKAPLKDALVKTENTTSPGLRISDAHSPLPDYRRTDFDPRSRAVRKPLPLFGYNFFASARSLVAARRASLFEQYSTLDSAAKNGISSTSRKQNGSSSSNSKFRNSGNNSGSATNESDNSSDGNSTAGKNSRKSNSSFDGNTDSSLNPIDAAAAIGAMDNTSTDGSDLLLGSEDITGRTRRPNSNDNSSGSSSNSSNSNNSNNGSSRNQNSNSSNRNRSNNSNNNYNNNDQMIDDNTSYNETTIDAQHEVADPISQIYRNVMASIPESYQLATGDVVTIRFWSPTITTRTVIRKIDASGSISMSNAGTIILRGQSLSSAQILLKERLRHVYRAVDVSISIREPRTIGVTVSGDAVLTGNFQVPAVATAYNVLYAAGGPTREGSLRGIEVYRQGKKIGSIDLYQMMTSGAQMDISLQAGDQIYIPGAQSHVELRGEVRREALYELKDGETLTDLLHFAGGAKPSAVNQAVQITTVTPGSTRLLKTVSLTDSSQIHNLHLYDGDSVEIFSLRLTLANKVTIEGAVDQPSEYALEPGMRVSDLIRLARGPLSEAYLEKAEIHRWNADNSTSLITVDLEKALAGDPNANIPLLRWDRLKVYTRQEVAWTGYRKVTITGAVQKPGVYDLSANTRVSNLLLMVGGPSPDAYLDRAYLLHQHGDGTYDYQYLRLKDAVLGDKDADLLIQDNDVLAVYKNTDARFIPEHSVSIVGEVVSPGNYPRGTQMKLSDLLALAGGFKPNAGTRVVITHARKVIEAVDSSLQSKVIDFDHLRATQPDNDTVLEDGDVITVQGVGGYVDHVQLITVRGAVNKPGAIALTSKNMRLSDAIREAGGLRPEAFAEGAEFYRNPSLLVTTGQRDLADTISRLSNLINDSQYKREQAKSDIERLKALGSAAAESAGPATAATANSPATALVASQLSQHELVSKPRVLSTTDLQPNGNIAVNLPDAMHKPAGSEDILLVDGDSITIPEQPTTIQVVGAVVNGRGVLYRPGATLEYYVEQVGGFAPDAAKDRIVIIHAGGGLIPSNKVKEYHAGDVILVPTKVLAEKIANNRFSLDSVFRSLTNSLLVYRLTTGIFGL